MRIIRKFLSVNDIYPANIRYDNGTDAVQFSPDGGTTWIDSPENDPRKTTHYPPPNTADPKCDSAARMTALIAELEAQFEAGLQSAAFGAEVATLILLLLAFVPLIGIMTALITAAYAQLVPLGYAAVHAAFDGFDWNSLECIIYRHSAGNGVLDEAALAAISNDMVAAYTGNQNFVLSLILAFTGYGVLNDAAAVRTETGECLDCQCYLDFACPWDEITAIEHGFKDCGSGVFRGEYIGFLFPIGYTTMWKFTLDLGGTYDVIKVDFHGASTGVANAVHVDAGDGNHQVGVNPGEYQATVTLPTPVTTSSVVLQGEGTNTQDAGVYVWVYNVRVWFTCP